VTPRDHGSAVLRLVAEDLGALLERAPFVAAEISAWSDPLGALESARDRMAAALRVLAIPFHTPDLHVAAGLPEAYDVPLLAAVSLDETDANHFELPAGIHLDGRRLLPYLSECTLGHVLVHSALGQRSPEHLGRGLEEGLCEVLGALHAAGTVIGLDTAADAFAAARLTPSRGPHREAFLDHVRSAALLHRRHGIQGLAELARSGRGAIKLAEDALERGCPEEVDLPEGEPHAALQDTLDRLLLARSRPSAVSPLAFALCQDVRTGGSFIEAADAHGVPHDRALEAARQLVDDAFVLVMDDAGTVLVDDLDLVLGSGALRYDCPSSPPSAG
jgi:hypothetical protein